AESDLKSRSRGWRQYTTHRCRRPYTQVGIRIRLLIEPLTCRRDPGPVARVVVGDVEAGRRSAGPLRYDLEAVGGRSIRDNRDRPVPRGLGQVHIEVGRDRGDIGPTREVLTLVLVVDLFAADDGPDCN